MPWLRFFLALAATLVLIMVFSRPIGKLSFPAGAMMSPFQGFWKNAEPVDYQHEPEINLPELEGPVEVVFDERGVPHIFAERVEDACMVQGYLTAADRLWQMDFTARAAAGRLSEVLGRGPDGVVLEMDRQMRRLGMVWAAKRSLEAIMADMETKNITDAYTKGINAYIEQLDPADYPLEFKLLNYKPEAWEPLKTALIMKRMAYTLSGSAPDLKYHNAITLWGANVADVLYPGRISEDAPIIPAGVKWPFFYGKAAPAKAPENYKPDSMLLVDALPQFPGAPEPDYIPGSNNWAVHGSKTSSGKPLLAGDPHLGLSLPSVWYEVQLHTPAANVYGVSLPGTPGVVIGFNDSVAWSVTNAGRDVLDHYRVAFRDKKKQQYRYQNRWETAWDSVETFKVKGESNFLDTVYYTKFGPVTYDERFGKFPTSIAVRWAAHEASNEMKTFVLLNRARSLQDYQKALLHYECPAQNFVFASVHGDVAITQQGKFAKRWKDQGRFLLWLSDSTHHWNEFIPTEHNPAVVNPAQGFVGSANQIPTDAAYPYLYYGDFETFRNRRLYELLSGAKNKLGAGDMKSFQLDNFSYKAADALPLMLAALDTTTFSPKQRAAMRMLRNWNRMYNAEAIEAPLFDTWWSLLREGIWKDEFEAVKLRRGLLPDRERKVPIAYPAPATVIRILRDSLKYRFYDDIRSPQTESRQQVITKAFLDAVDEMYRFNPDPEKWQWSGYKNTSIQHLIPMLKPFHRTGISTGGGASILNATSERWGPSWRMVVSLDKKHEAWGIYPGGQSGNPGSPRYDRFIDDWASGNYYPLWFMQGPNESGKQNTTRILFRKS